MSLRQLAPLVLAPLVEAGRDLGPTGNPFRPEAGAKGDPRSRRPQGSKSPVVAGPAVRSRRSSIGGRSVHARPEAAQVACHEEERMNPATTTLAELALSRPGATRVLQSRGLDYCCGGRRSIAEACAEKGIDPAEIVSEIEEEASADAYSARWTTAPLGALIEFIEGTYHRKLRLELPDPIGMAAKVEETHAEKPDCPRGLADHLRAAQGAVLSHLEKEEKILFPMIRSGRGAAASAPIRVMEMEHDDHGETLAQTQRLTGNLTVPPEACTTWRALYLRLRELESDLMDHIHLENNVLFPRALQQS
jgi:regulator of cell morphogenesis and NO signaling